jgi:hypothetical protein
MSPALPARDEAFRTRRQLPSSLFGLTEHCWQIMKHLFVGESDDAIAGLGQKRIAFCIALSLRCVDCTIQFDNQSPLGTAEIRHERPYRMLPTELDAIQLPAS